MNNMTIEIIQGNKVTNEDLELINKYRKIRLSRDRVWDHKINNEFHDRTFFLVRDNNQLVAFGTLRDIKIYINDIEVTIKGIQAIISIIQGMGYGKYLMQNMIKYAINNNLILIGFCERKNKEFYIKSGLEVFEDKNLNFIYINEKLEEYSEEGDVIYYSKENNIVREAIVSNIKIKHFIPHW